MDKYVHLQEDAWKIDIKKFLNVVFNMTWISADIKVVNTVAQI